MEPTDFSLQFSQGSILVSAPPSAVQAHLVWDERTKQWRAPAFRYRDIIMEAEAQKLARQDHCRHYEKLNLHLQQPVQPRPDQAAALLAWLKAGGRGTVCLPTGA